jgi:plastocyanin
MKGTVIVDPPTATVLVGSGGLVFFPATASIPVNGRIIWNWAGSGHSTTSGNNGSVGGDGLWNSGVNNLPHSFTNTFTTAGSFPYYCIPHFSSGMKGTIVVTNAVAPNLPPTVTITNPASGTTLSAPASLTLAASADDSDGSVANVQFLQGATSLGNVAAAPFSMAVNNLAAGDYTFSAVASDNLGATATNSIVVHVINAGPVTVSAPAFATADHFQFSYTADIGLSYVVQVSTNLLDWTPLATNTATASPVIFSDPNAGGGAAFYRVERRPNP